MSLFPKLPALAILLGGSGVLALESEYPQPRVSTVSGNGMPKDIVEKRADWNFGNGSLWTHLGWQYAAYWDDACQVTVARRQLPDGAWTVASLPGYQRTATHNRGKGGAISQGFGDGHEKVSMGISPDGVIHLCFDHHLSSLRYRTSKKPVAAKPTAYEWSGELFGPVQDHLGGAPIDSVTYPAFTSDGENFMLYLRLNGGSGSADSHFFRYTEGKWQVNTPAASKLIDKNWSGGDKTVNAYPHGLVIRDSRWHLTWCWRDTPDSSTSHDLCYAYSDDLGKTWLNNTGQEIARTGITFITADSPDVAVWKIPSGKKYLNGGSMTVSAGGKVHVLVRGEDGSPAYFERDPQTRKWSRHSSSASGSLLVGEDDSLYLVSDQGLQQVTQPHLGGLKSLAKGTAAFFKDSKIAVDRTRAAQDGWVSVIGQNGKTITVVDYWIGKPSN